MKKKKLLDKEFLYLRAFFCDRKSISSCRRVRPAVFFYLDNIAGCYLSIDYCRLFFPAYPVWMMLFFVYGFVS